MRARARCTIKSFSARLERWRRGRATPALSLAQAKMSGGEKGGDLLDDGINEFFLILHMRLLKDGQCLGNGGG
jgi:hypothetical protein